MAYDVFISYRRQGGGADARMMYDRLTQAGYSVSFDMDTLKNGNFNDELIKRVAECKNFVVLLSENCFERTLNGCKRENDWLRIEIATALYNNKNIVTVMLPGFTFPEKLPSDIDAIRNKNGPKYDLYYIDGFYDKLQRDFLLTEAPGAAGAVSNLETVADTGNQASDETLLDLLGDDTDFLREEALPIYSGVSRLLPFDELRALDACWQRAEAACGSGAYRDAAAAYLETMELARRATPCSSAFVLRMTADGIDTRAASWFACALERAQSGDTDYQYGIGMLYAGGLGVAQDAAAAFRWFDRAAAGGHLQAMAAVGATYASGKGVEPDYQAAHQWLSKAAQQGYGLANERLGYLYQHGLGVEKDLARAAGFYEAAAQIGYAAAQTALAVLYETGEGVPENRDRAIELYRQAIADDHPVALRRLAALRFTDGAVDEAIALCRRAVDAGDVEAILLLGKAYENGSGTEQDFAKAEELYLKALEKGSDSARTALEELEPDFQFRRAIELLEGVVCPCDIAQARSWLAKAADRGHVHAMARLAMLLEDGLGGEVDVPRAIELYEAADSQHSAVAALRLGCLYFRGRKVPCDDAKAVDAFKRAAAGLEQCPESEKWQVVYAWYYLAQMYHLGQGVVRDPLLAARFYRVAAQLGNIPACKALALCYRDGIGVGASPETSARWFAEMWRLAETALNPCDGLAMERLGDAALNALGIRRDPGTAIHWFRRAIACSEYGTVPLLNFVKMHRELCSDEDIVICLQKIRNAADGGDAMAMANLGVLHRYGYFGAAIDPRLAVEWYRKAIDRGHVGSMWHLAHLYMQGDGGQQDHEAALDLLQRAADRDYADAQIALAKKYFGGTSLGRDYAKVVALCKALPADPDALNYLELCYRDGLGIPEDAAKAASIAGKRVGILSRRAEVEDEAAQDTLARCYHRGRGVDRNLPKARELYEKAAAGQEEEAMYALIGFLRYGACGEPDIAASDARGAQYVAHVTQPGHAASRGAPEACERVGDCYRFGEGVSRDPVEAAAWYRKAAERKSWHAMLSLARMLRAGEGCAPDPEGALEWEKKAVDELLPLATNGLAEAQCALGDCACFGLGMAEDAAAAAAWYREAAEGGDWRATGRLARLLREGRGLPEDPVKALELLMKAAQKEDPDACAYLGECYERGELVAADTREAVAYYRRAANEGNAAGLFNLGRCYLEGIGTEQNRAKGEYFLRLAVSAHEDPWGYARKAADCICRETPPEGA